MGTLRTALIGQTGILSIKKNGKQISRYRTDLGNAEIDISSAEKTTTTGSFSTINGGKYESCVVAFSPIQSGSGDPSPSNVRPITGHSSVEVTVSDENETVIEDITVSLGNTYYGGTLDVVNGKLTIDNGFYEFDGTENWAKSTNTSCDVYMISVSSFDLSNPFITSAFKYTSSTTLNVGEVRRGSSDAQIRVGFATYGTTTLQDFISWLTTNHLQVVWKLATPTVIQLTPQQINSLIGENHLDVPLTGQSLMSAVYRDMFSWSDVEDVVEEVDEKKADISAIGTDESGRTTASRSYAQGEHFYKGGKFGKTKTAVAQGATWTLNTNYEESTIAEAIDNKSTNQLTADSGGVLNSQACVTLGHIFIAVYVLTANNTTSVVSGFPTLVTQSNAPTALIRNLSNGQVMTTNNYIVNGKHTMGSLTSGTAYAVTIIGII